jgi:hypothetical protein
MRMMTTALTYSLAGRSRLVSSWVDLIAGSEAMQKSSGFGIGKLTEPEWRSSAGFGGVAADGFSA